METSSFIPETKPQLACEICHDPLIRKKREILMEHCWNCNKLFKMLRLTVYAELEPRLLSLAYTPHDLAFSEHYGADVRGHQFNTNTSVPHFAIVNHCTHCGSPFVERRLRSDWHNYDFITIAVETVWICVTGGEGDYINRRVSPVHTQAQR